MNAHSRKRGVDGWRGGNVAFFVVDSMRIWAYADKKLTLEDTMPGKRSVYIPEDYWNKLLEVTRRLDVEGYEVRDQRGNLSVSAAIRVLADEKLTTRKLGGKKA